MNPADNTSGSPVIRLAHLSDVHVTAKRLGWTHRDWFNKRVTGYINYRLLGRKHSFRHAEQVLEAIVNELRERRPDRVVFSGDATALGFEAEFIRAVASLGVTDPAMPPGLAVPGNHDYYTRSSAAAGLFERYFAPWQQGDRLDDQVYPFAQRVGPLWLIGVNSCTGNRWSWDAAGLVGLEQLQRLERLLQHLEPGPRILVTHYPVARTNGKPELYSHNLRDVDRLVATAARGGVRLWLHGHRHEAYHLPRLRMAPFPVVCAGSATQFGVWSYHEYTIRGNHVHALRRVYAARERRFHDGHVFEFELPTGEMLW